MYVNVNHTSPGPPHPASSPPRSSEISLLQQTVCITIIISAQTVRNHLREAHLNAHHPHRGLDLTTVSRRNRLEWANAHIRWRLALWRGVLFTEESQFSLYRADGRQRVWHCVGERFAYVNVVDDKARPHVARISTQFLEAENIPVLAWPAFITGHVTH